MLKTWTSFLNKCARLFGTQITVPLLFPIANASQKFRKPFRLILHRLMRSEQKLPVDAWKIEKYTLRKYLEIFLTNEDQKERKSKTWYATDHHDSSIFALYCPRTRYDPSQVLDHRNTIFQTIMPTQHCATSFAITRLSYFLCAFQQTKINLFWVLTHTYTNYRVLGPT